MRMVNELPFVLEFQSCLPVEPLSHSHERQDTDSRQQACHGREYSSLTVVFSQRGEIEIQPLPVAANFG